MPDPNTAAPVVAPVVETPAVAAPVETPTVDAGADSGDALDQSILDAWDDAGIESDPEEADADTTPEPETAKTAVEDSAAVVTPEKPAQVTQQEADDLATALGLPAPPTDPKERQKWWTKKLNYSKVHQVVTDREKKLTDAHTAALTEHTTKIQKHEARLSNVDKIEKIMNDDPLEFVQMLHDKLPGYAELFERLGLKIGSDGGGAGSRREAPAQDEMPQPDYDLGNGQFTYSVEGLQKRDEWHARQVEARVMQRLSPLLQRQQAEEEAIAAEQVIAANIPAARTQLERAEATRPLFKEHKAEILAKLRSDPQMGLEDAYWDVVGPKLQTDRNKMRQELIEEQKRIPLSTTTGPSVAAHRSDDGDDLDSKLEVMLKGIV